MQSRRTADPRHASCVRTCRAAGRGRSLLTFDGRRLNPGDQRYGGELGMSMWRKEALHRLPELSALISSPNVDNPMMLWIELQIRFDQLCEKDPLPLELLRRLWGYAKWSMEQRHDALVTAVHVAFCEHLLGRERVVRALPQIMTRRDFLSMRQALLYHNPASVVDRIADEFEPPSTKRK